MKREQKTDNLVLAALMTCLVCLATYALKIPNPVTQGYVHIGDVFIFMSVLVLGKKTGAIASSVGAAMADIMGGYAVFAVGTFIAKGLMAFIMGILIEKGRIKSTLMPADGIDASPALSGSDAEAKSEEEGTSVRNPRSEASVSAPHHRRLLSFSLFDILAMAAGGFSEVLVYVFVNAAVYGNFTVGFLSIPGNILQFTVSMVIAVILVHALLKTPVRKYFAFAGR